MALNIVATRRVSLKGFAEGWDDCYLTVKAMNRDELEATRSAISEDLQDAEAMRILREKVSSVITGGRVINTKDDGTTETVDLQDSDIPVVADALGVGWIQTLFMTASGADRLKV